MPTKLPNVTIQPKRDEQGNVVYKKPKKKRFGWSRLSMVMTLVLMFLVGPVLIGFSIWITDAVGNTEGALAALAASSLLVVLQLIAYVPAVIGLVVGDPKMRLSVAAILIGLIVLGFGGMIGYASLLDLT